ncbi:MAG: hypothetical protein QHJ82_17135, partial [Verrucomicrobiota bacterium]|nr:hypothetical protein [Verrucomicrobiota bacterium]
MPGHCDSLITTIKNCPADIFGLAGVVDSFHQRAQARGHCLWGNFGSGYAAVHCYTEESLIFAKISTPRVWSIPAYL